MKVGEIYSKSQLDSLNWIFQARLGNCLILRKNKKCIIWNEHTNKICKHYEENKKYLTF